MPSTYEKPHTLDVALDMLASGGWTVLSGGTDVFPGLTDAQAWGRPGPQRILDISGIGELGGIEIRDDEVRLGARATWTEMIEADLPPYFNTLKAAGREVGGVQIQNRGTIAGNICNASPAADGVPALIALDADVELSGQGGIRRLAVAEFIQGNRRTALQDGELVTAIYVPRRSSRALSNFLKLGARRYLIISIAMVAVVVDIDKSGAINHAGVAIGSCSEVAQRLNSLEENMIGRWPEEDLSALVTRDTLSPLSPIDDIRADAAYRMDAAQRLVQRALADLGTE